MANINLLVNCRNDQRCSLLLRQSELNRALCLLFFSQAGKHFDRPEFDVVIRYVPRLSSVAFDRLPAKHANPANKNKTMLLGRREAGVSKNRIQTIVFLNRTRSSVQNSINV